MSEAQRSTVVWCRIFINNNLNDALQKTEARKFHICLKNCMKSSLSLIWSYRKFKSLKAISEIQNKWTKPENYDIYLFIDRQIMCDLTSFPVNKWIKFILPKLSKYPLKSIWPILLMTFHKLSVAIRGASSLSLICFHIVRVYSKTTIQYICKS